MIILFWEGRIDFFHLDSMAAVACKSCLKSVYPLEAIVIDSVSYHKQCFRCKAPDCNMVLSLTNYAMIHGDSYCKPHFKQIFAEKGGQYDAFGQDPNHKQWEKVNYTPGMTIKSKIVGNAAAGSGTPASVTVVSPGVTKPINTPVLASSKATTLPTKTSNVSVAANFGVSLNKTCTGASSPLIDIFRAKTADGVLEYINARGGVKSLLADRSLLEAFSDDCKVAGKIILEALLQELNCPSDAVDMSRRDAPSAVADVASNMQEAAKIDVVAQ